MQVSGCKQFKFEFRAKNFRFRSSCVKSLKNLFFFQIFRKIKKVDHIVWRLGNGMRKWREIQIFISHVGRCTWAPRCRGRTSSGTRWNPRRRRSSDRPWRPACDCLRCQRSKINLVCLIVFGWVSPMTYLWTVSILIKCPILIEPQKYELNYQNFHAPLLPMQDSTVKSTLKQTTFTLLATNLFNA